MSTEPTPRIRSKDIAIALSLANICYLRIWAEILAVTSTEAYFLHVANSDVFAVVLNVILLAGVFLVATAVARGFGRAGEIAIVVGFVFVLLAQLNGLGPELAPGVLAVVDRWKNGLYLEALAPAIVLAGLAAVCWRWPQRALSATVGLIYILTPFVGVTFFRAFWILTTFNPTTTLAPTAPPIGATVTSAAGPRVVLIVMDALSRRHAVDARPDGFELPEFDRLRGESVDATQVTQIGRATKISLPAMLSGLRVTDSHPLSADDLLLTIDSSATQPWSSAPNLLRDAQAMGGVGILSGWYHPYCRLFPDLDGCSTYPTRTIGSRGRDTGFLRALRDQQLALIPYLSLRLRQVEIVESQFNDALVAATTGDRGLIVLHMILPHTPWIWDEAAESYTLTRFHPDGYYGNLALMDRQLGALRRAMDGAGKWDSTAVVLVSDHVMRYRPAYLNEPPDRRVPLLVKLPGVTEGLSYDRPINAMVTHDLVAALLRGELRTTADVTAWLDDR